MKAETEDRIVEQMADLIEKRLRDGGWLPPSDALLLQEENARLRARLQDYEHDCEHSCCTDRNNPHHDHFLDAEDCQQCVRARSRCECGHMVWEHTFMDDGNDQTCEPCRFCDCEAVR